MPAPEHGHVVHGAEVGLGGPASHRPRDAEDVGLVAASLGCQCMGAHVALVAAHEVEGVPSRHQDERPAAHPATLPTGAVSLLTRVRSVLFCNEMLGLGHLRLSLAVAGALVEQDDRSSALVVTGSPAFAGWRLPPGV